MALTDYTGLLAGLARFSVRSDQTDTWPDCVAMAEAEFNRSLKVQPMQVRADAVLDTEFFALPDDFRAVVSFEILDPVVRLQSTSAGNLARMRERNDAYRADWGCDGVTTPRYYARVGSEFRVFPAPQDGESWDCELTYWANIPALADNDTNWLLTEHPDAYLYGALVQFGIMTEDERLGAWTQAYANALNAIREAYPVETDKAPLRTDLPLTRCY